MAIDHGDVAIEVDAVACPRCAEGKGCGAAVFGSSSGKRRVVAKMPTGVQLATGDTVSLALAPGRLLAAAGVVYGYPLVGAAIGALVGYQMALGDPGAAVCALVGLTLGVALGRARIARDACLSRFVPTITGRSDLKENIGILRRSPGPPHHEADP